MPTLEEVLIAIKTAYDRRQLQQAKKDLEVLAKRYKKFGNVYATNAKEAKKFSKSTAQGFMLLRGRLMLLGKSLQIFGRQFRMEYLSILFFGMFLRRTFGGILRDGVNMFTKLMEASQIYTTATQRLAIHWEYLKFTIGSAINTVLEPLMPLLVSIISKITEWIQTHPQLTGKIVIFGTALGSALFLLAMFRLTLSSATKILGDFVVAITNAPNFFKKFKSKVKEIVSWVGIGMKWAFNVAKLAVIKLGAAFAWLAANPWVLLLAAIIAIIVYLVILTKKLGGVGELFKSVLRGVLRLAVFAAEFLINKVFLPVLKFISKIPILKKKFGWAKKLGGLEKVDLRTPYFEWERQHLAPKKGYMEFGGLFPKEMSKDLTQDLTQDMSQDFDDFFKNMNLNFDELTNQQVQKQSEVFDTMETTWTKDVVPSITTDWTKNATPSFTSDWNMAVGQMADSFHEALKNAAPKVRTGVYSLFPQGSYQFGGLVPKGGLYRLHGGEYVVPAGGYPPMNVTININGANADPREIARQINEELGRMYRTLRR